MCSRNSAICCSRAVNRSPNSFALPDGETGYRQGWINFLAAKTYAVSEQLESITRPQPIDPNDPDEWRAPDMDWMPRGFQDHWQFKVKKGTGPLYFEYLGYAQEAKNSYQTFCTLRDQGIIPQGVRFQVSLPLIESGTRLFWTFTRVVPAHVGRVSGCHGARGHAPQSGDSSS